MNDYIVTIDPVSEMSSKVVDTINRVAGHVFDNGDVEIEFFGVRPDARPPINSVMFQLSHKGVEAQGYVSPESVQRLLGVDVQFLEPEYVSYLFSQKAVRYGVNRICYMQDLTCEPQPFIDVCFRLGDITIKGALNAKALSVGGVFLHQKGQEISGEIKLSVCWSPFETALHTEEIFTLSEHDLVLVFPK